MTPRTTFLLLCISLAGCTSEQSSNTISGADSLKNNGTGIVLNEEKGNIIKPIVQPNPTNKGNLWGIWGNEGSENAIFDIKTDSIYYVDEMRSYKYSLVGDTIIIYYPDYSYKSKVRIKGDTLIMDSEVNGQAKFWRFKN